jgi:hypothetical protein
MKDARLVAARLQTNGSDPLALNPLHNCSDAVKLTVYALKLINMSKMLKEFYIQGNVFPTVALFSQPTRASSTSRPASCQIRIPMTDAKKAASAAKSKAGASKTADEQNESMQPGGDAESLLRSDHRKVEQLFQQYQKAGDTAEKRELAQQICLELIVHTKIEEEIFYPACREEDVEHEMLNEAQVEHDGAKVLIAELLNGLPDDQFYDAKVTVLAEYIRHHVAEEEKPDEGIFAEAREAGVDMEALGPRIQSRKTELMARSDALTSRAPQPRSLCNPAFKGGQHHQEDHSMARYANDRDRDEYGRFVSDDDRREYSSRRRYDEDDDYRGYRGNERPRDEEGRFMSESGGRSRGGYESRSPRYDDDDDYRSSRGRERGGWYGDREGHSEASERGWEHRGSSRGGYSSRSSRYDDDDNYRSSRGGRGQGGWYGDPEGHSEASERGWEHRGSSRGGYSSRSSRYDEDEDDRRSSRGGRGHGGWFGDPRGHSEAARRGWEDR